MEKEYVLMNDKLRKLHNELLIKNELIRILKAQVEDALFHKALDQAREHCKKKFKKKNPK